MQADFLSDREQQVLEVETRRQIFAVVKDYPGTHFREIERKSKLSTGSTQYHLEYLRKQGLIKAEKEGKHIRYFPKEFSTQDQQLMALLRQRSIRSILLYILSNKNCIHEQIVESVKLSPSTVSWHIKKLVSSKAITATRKGRKTHYQVEISEKELMKLLISFQESFVDRMVDNIVEMWEN